MSAVLSSSSDINDYEILIRRRGENDYASYCPQLNHMMVGTEHEEVRNMMNEYIEQYIQNLKNS